MAKARTKRRDERGPLQRALDRERAERDTAPLVNAFAAAQGDYEKNLRFVVNRGGTAVARWANAKPPKLSESQVAGILHCQALWARIGSQSVVIDFDKVRGLPHGDGYSQHEALSELARIKAGFPADIWSVFENVCRFDEPAGVAGSRLAGHKRAPESAARLIVAMVADMIAMRERLSY